MHLLILLANSHDGAGASFNRANRDFLVVASGVSMSHSYARQKFMAAAITKALKSAGFQYVALDLEGYRQGSLNEALSKSAGT